MVRSKTFLTNRARDLVFLLGISLSISACGIRAKLLWNWDKESSKPQPGFATSSGGGTSTGGTISLTGTAGLPDAHAPLTGGTITLQPGPIRMITGN